MGDILEIFETLQKKLQRSDLFISYRLTVTDAAVKKLSLMRYGPFPGRREETTCSVQMVLAYLAYMSPHSMQIDILY